MSNRNQDDVKNPPPASFFSALASATVGAVRKPIDGAAGRGAVRRSAQRSTLVDRAALCTPAPTRRTCSIARQCLRTNWLFGLCLARQCSLLTLQPIRSCPSVCNDATQGLLRGARAAGAVEKVHKGGQRCGSVKAPPARDTPSTGAKGSAEARKWRRGDEDHSVVVLAVECTYRK